MINNYYLLPVLLCMFTAFCTANTLSENLTANTDVVFVKSQTNIKRFEVPTSEEPLLSWMDVQRGVFPNTSIIQRNLTVGDPMTIFIYFMDKSYLYDIKVTDCWAYDDKDVVNSTNRLHLTPHPTKSESKVISVWRKQNFTKGNDLKSILYANLTSFKFPDKSQLYLTCDVQLCFKTCEKRSKKVHS